MVDFTDFPVTGTGPVWVISDNDLLKLPEKMENYKIIINQWNNNKAHCPDVCKCDFHVFLM